MPLLDSASMRRQTHVRSCKTALPTSRRAGREAGLGALSEAVYGSGKEGIGRQRRHAETCADPADGQGKAASLVQLQDRFLQLVHNRLSLLQLGLHGAGIIGPVPGWIAGRNAVFAHKAGKPRKRLSRGLLVGEDGDVALDRHGVPDEERLACPVGHVARGMAGRGDGNEFKFWFRRDAVAVRKADVHGAGTAGQAVKVGNGPLDEDLSVFIASAGLIVANADKKVTEKEVEHIIQNLAGLQIFPKRFLDMVAETDVSKLFNESVNRILNKDPGMRDAILSYMIGLVMSDKDISDDEIGLIYSFGKNIGFSEKEISVKFAEMIQRNYVPSLESIC